MDEIELKPCPFCGSEAHIFEFLNGYGIKCNQCNGCVSADMYQGYEETIRMWNRRADND